MSQAADAAPAEQLVMALPIGRGWMIPGGEEDDSGITLHVVASTPDGRKPRRYDVRIHLLVDEEGSLGVGEVTVEELP